MDINTLHDRQITALEDVQQLTLRLARAQDFAYRIAKRIKTMRESQGGPMPPADARDDTEMEKID